MKTSKQQQSNCTLVVGHREGAEEVVIIQTIPPSPKNSVDASLDSLISSSTTISSTNNNRRSDESTKSGHSSLNLSVVSGATDEVTTSTCSGCYDDSSSSFTHQQHERMSSLED